MQKYCGTKEYNMKHRKKTFTLAEVLLSLAILSFALCALLAGYIAASLLNRSSRHLTIAASHTNWAMETVKETNFNALANRTLLAADITPFNLEPLQDEVITISITGSQLRNVTVTTAWVERGSSLNTVTACTSIAEP